MHTFNSYSSFLKNNHNISINLVLHTVYYENNNIEYYYIAINNKQNSNLVLLQHIEEKYEKTLLNFTEPSIKHHYYRDYHT